MAPLTTDPTHVLPRHRVDCRNGQAIWYEPKSVELNEVQRRAMRQIFSQLGFQGPVRDSATYNCAGHVFAGRRGVLTDGLEHPSPGNIAEIGDLVMQVLASDGYRRRGQGETPRPGDVVVYCRDGRIEHVGIVLSAGLDDPIVNSKFGLYGEYRHPMNNVPEFYGHVDGIWAPKGYEDE